LISSEISSLAPAVRAQSREAVPRAPRRRLDLSNDLNATGRGVSADYLFSELPASTDAAGAGWAPAAGAREPGLARRNVTVTTSIASTVAAATTARIFGRSER